MKTLSKERMLCVSCMEEHEVKRVIITESNVFKGETIKYNAEYFYCDRTKEIFADEHQLSLNDTSMKDAYREKIGLLTSHQIAGIRAKYGISQSDLCQMLSWGPKTITRYEGHQVQDMAHDTILRKLDSDPEWFLQLINARKDSFSAATYGKYIDVGTALFESEHDMYLKSAIMSKYARFLHNPEASGGKTLSLAVVTDMIRYYANSPDMKNLFLVKLIKSLWYGDALSYKRHGHSISGMVYRALPTGAVPIAYESILDLSEINYEEIDMGDGTGYLYLPTKDKEYPHLSSDDMDVLDAVIQRFGKSSKVEIVDTMHHEDAYTETAPYDVIQFKYAKTLSIS